MQDRRKGLRLDARNRHRRGHPAGGHRRAHALRHAEVQGHAAPDRQHQPRGAREPHRPARGARVQRRGLPGSQVHRSQQGTHRDPAVHQPRHGHHDAVDEHHHERPDARRLLDRRVPHRRCRRRRQAHHLLQHGGVLQLLHPGHHELPAAEHGVRALAASRRVRAARARSHRHRSDGRRRCEDRRQAWHGRRNRIPQRELRLPRFSSSHVGRRQFHSQEGRNGRIHRLDRLRQIVPHQPRAAFLRRHARRGARRRRQRARLQAEGVARQDRLRAAAVVPVQGNDRQQRRVRRYGPRRRHRAPRMRRRAGDGIHRQKAEEVRFRHFAGRFQRFGRAEAASVDRTRRLPSSGNPDLRRLLLRARLQNRPCRT